MAWRLPLPLGLAFLVAETVFLGIFEMALLQPKPDVLSVRDLCRLGGAILFPKEPAMAGQFLLQIGSDGVGRVSPVNRFAAVL